MEIDFEIENRIISVGDINLHVVLAGPDDGPLLILLHGFPEFWYGWHKQIPALADAGFRVAAPDQRGYNLSDKPASITSYRLARLAEDVVALAEALGHRQFYLAGHDWGAAVAWHTAECYPERVLKLAVLNVPYPGLMARTYRRDFKQVLKSWYIGWFQLPVLPELGLRLFGKRMMRASANVNTFSETDLERYHEAWRREGAARSMINWYRAMVRQAAPDLFKRQLPPLPTFDMPVLIMWGMNDVALTNDLAEQSLALCKNGSLIQVEDATHWVQHDAAEQVNTLLVDHFKDPDLSN